jgi:hypothetical protein
MAIRKPVVMVDGQLQQLQAVDTLEGATSNIEFGATNSNAAAITVGQPVYVNGAGSVDLALGNAIGTAKVAGLVIDASIAASAAGKIRHSGTISSTDWTAVTGAATLTPGARYFLSKDNAGQLTTTAPNAVGEVVTAVGVALSTEDLLVEIDRPVLL